MPRRTARSLPLIVASALGVVAATPAHAFTPPIGSDKGSITAVSALDGSTRVVVTKYYDMPSPY